MYVCMCLVKENHNGLNIIKVIYFCFLISVIFHNALPFVGFGFFDNAIMIVAVSQIYLNYYFNHVTSSLKSLVTV